MVSFLVEADLVVSDKATKMLRDIGAQFERIDKLSKGIGKGFASEGIGRAATQMERLSKTVAIASKESTTLGESLNRLRVSSSAASGIDRISSALASATSRATALSRALASVRSPPTGGSVPSTSGRTPAPAGAPHGQGRGPLSTAMHVARSGMYAYMDAQIAGQIAKTVFGPSIAFGDERFLAGQLLGPGSGTQVGRLETAAYATARTVPSVSATEALKLGRELYPIAMSSVGPGGDPLGETLHWMPQAAKYDALMNNLMGEKGGDQGHRMSQFYNALRAGELLNKNTSTGRLDNFVEGVIRSVIASGGAMDAGDFLAFAKTGKTAAASMDDSFLTKDLPEIMMELGGPRTGTMASTFMRSTMGRATKDSIMAAKDLGLVDPSKIQQLGGGHIALDYGAWKDQGLRMSNPMAWLLKDVAPALENPALGGKRVDLEAAKLGDQEMRNRLTWWMNKLFSDRNAAQMGEELLMQARQIAKHHALTDQVDMDYEKMRQTAPGAALLALNKQLDSLGSTIGLVRDNLGLINTVTDSLSWLAQKRSEHPGMAQTAEIGLGAGGAILGGWAAYRFLTAGPALTGAAGRLSVAAGELSAAAGRLAGRGSVPGAVPGEGAVPKGPGLLATSAGIAVPALIASMGAWSAYKQWQTLNENWDRKDYKIDPWSQTPILDTDLPKMAGPVVTDVTGGAAGSEISVAGSGGRAATGAGADLSGAAAELKGAAGALAAAAAGKSSIFSPGVGEAAGTTHLPGGGVMVDIPPGSGAEGGVVAGTHGGIAAGGEGAGGGGGAAALQAAAGALQQVAGAIQATANRPVNMTGTVTLTGNVNVNMGQLGSQIAALVAKGVAKAASGGGGNSGGARPDTSGGSKAPSPN